MSNCVLTNLMPLNGYYKLIAITANSEQWVASTNISLLHAFWLLLILRTPSTPVMIEYVPEGKRYNVIAAAELLGIYIVDMRRGSALHQVQKRLDCYIDHRRTKYDRPRLKLKKA